MHSIHPSSRHRFVVPFFVVLVLVAGGALRAQQRVDPRASRAAAPPAVAVEPVDSKLFQALEWRNVGPFRGGRATTVAGVPSQPRTFYMGATGGGVWKTDDDGLTWRNISDGFLKTGSVGAIAVADSDPNVVYVGMGEAPVRGVATSHGDGVYKSTDAGRTWTRLGLEKTRHISAIAIHPANADIVYVAAQGSPWAPTPDRGIYKSVDGGKTWTRAHAVSQNSGPSALSMDATNPRILYAAYWDHQRTPWQVRSGGPDSGIYKTTDEGATWKKLTDGLPALMGKIGIAVSPARPERVYANIEAEDGGVFRSDDAGQSWKRVSDDRLTRARSWYYTHIIADPRDANIVYVMNAPFLKSIDAGVTWTPVEVPHGDNHALWINPRDPQAMINANDGGANISHNGGRSWSTQANQPTAQFYRVVTDRRFPYFLYGGQQDNTTVAIPSRTFGGGIERQDWFQVGGCESAWVAMDLKAPRHVYATCYHGIISEHDLETGKERNVMAYPILPLAEPSNELKYRFNWNGPVIVSQHDPKVIYQGAQMLLRSTDRGQTWTAASPDLTRNEKDKQGFGGSPITNEGAGGEVYNTIFYVAESPREANELWIGTDDGLVQLTRDGGQTWSNVTPKEIGVAQINAIELSPHDAGTAYVAATKYKFNDFTPHVFRTTDYGRTWTRVVSGIGEDAWVRVVREDPVKKGLLYAGAETGLYVSFDAGARWQPFQLNLPVVPVTDLQVHGNDLVAATQGRAFWILDDVTPLRQIAPGAAAEARLFEPAEGLRVEGASGNTSGVGKNPPNGAILYYTLADEPKAPATLEILDASGAVLRAFSSAEPAKDAPAPVAPRLPAKAGLNRFVWNLRPEPIARVPGLTLLHNMEGARVAPGRYQVRLTVAGKALTAPLMIAGDPRSVIAPDAWRAWEQVTKTLYRYANEINRTVVRLRSARAQATALAEHVGADQKVVGDAAKALADRITAVEGGLVQTRHRTFQDVINFRNQLGEQLRDFLETVDGTEPPLTGGIERRFHDLEVQWQAKRAEAEEVLTKDVAAFNATVAKQNVQAVVVPKP